MRKTITLFAFMASTFCLLAQQVWREGTSWEVHYDDASVETFALQGTTEIQNTMYLNLMRSDKSLVGYIRAERGDSLVYARGIKGNQVLDESLLYDFRKSFEYGDEFHYASSSQAASVTLSRQTARIVYYRDILNEGEELPAWDNVVYKVGFLGNPMGLYYQSGSEFFPGINYAQRVKPSNTNVSHIVFRPGGGKPCKICTVKYEDKEPADEMSDFAFRLYDTMIKRSADPNMVMSPLSAQMALSMLMNGTSGNTLEQIREAMGIGNYTDEQVNSYNMQLVESMLALQEEEYVNLELINGLWTQRGYPFLETFYQDIRNYYEAEPENVDFSTQETVNQINAWAKEKSHGLIEKIMDQPSYAMTFMIANSLYFKGKWPKYFDQKDTYKGIFRNRDGSTTEVDMLSGLGMMPAKETDDYLAVELEYGNKETQPGEHNFGMLVFLPKGDKERPALTRDRFLQALNGLQLHYINLRIPRFKVDMKSDLDSVFIDMGMKDMFDLNRANLTRMTEEKPCYVGSSQQFVSYSIDENGTEAAGITVINGGGFGESPWPITVDRDFQFVLYDKVHRVPLFIGEVNNMAEAMNTKPMDNGSIEGFFCNLDKERKEATIMPDEYGRGQSYTGDLVIPSVIHYQGEEYTVTEIGRQAFYESYIKSVTFPPTLRKINEGAFFQCFQLDSIAIPEGVEIEGTTTFSYCPNLRKVVLPSNMTRIPWGCFNGCARLEQVNIPQSVTKIEELAFQECKSLEAVILPPALSDIGKNAFFNCEKLNHISIPDAVTHIGMFAFMGCNSLEWAEFSSLESLFGITYDNRGSSPLYHARHLIIGGEEIPDLVIPMSVRHINESLFEHHQGLRSVTIPASIDSIGANAFSNCTNLQSVKFLHSAALIEANAFQGCRNLKELDLSDKVVSIGTYAFEKCDSLEYVAIPASVRTIGAYAFSQCRSLKYADFQSIESLCGMEFDGPYCNPMRFTNSLIVQGEEVEHLVIPDGVREIRNYAFGYAKNLKSVLIPPSVEVIGEGAFLGTTNIETIYMLCNSMPQTDSRSFTIRKSVTLYVPEHLVAQYKASPLWKDFKAILPLPDDFQGIGKVHEHSAEDVIYDLQGRRLTKAPEKGIYIKNGRKIVE